MFPKNNLAHKGLIYLDWGICVSCVLKNLPGKLFTDYKKVLSCEVSMPQQMNVEF